MSRVSEKVVKLRRREEDLREAFTALSNQVLALQDTIMLLNFNLSALVELHAEGRPITKETVQRRAEIILRQSQEEWMKMQPSESEE
jgi:hypothetical protein